MCQATETAGIHPFEVAGLGKAPFKLVGFGENWFKTGDPSNPVKPGGSCQYCFTAIAYECHIESADGRRFKVGCDCVRKLDRADNRLVSQVEREWAKVQKAAATKRTAERKAKEADRIKAAVARLDEARESLASQPHPKIKGSDLTLLSYVEWMLGHAGHKGRLEAAKLIEKNSVIPS